MPLRKLKTTLFIFLILTLFNKHDCSIKSVLSNITNVASFLGVPYAGLANTAVNLLMPDSTNSSGSNSFNPQFLYNQERILAGIEHMHSSIEDYKKHVEKTFQDTDLSNGLIELTKKLNIIDGYFKKMLKLNESGADATKFKNKHRDESKGSLKDLKEIYYLVFPIKTIDLKPLKDRSLQSIISDNFKDYSKLCNTHKSQHSLLKEIFDEVLLAKQKVNRIVEFCFENQLNYTDYQEDQESISEQFSEYSTMEKDFLESVDKADQKIWRCDPSTEGEQQYTLMNILQVYFVQEDAILDGCTGSCTRAVEAKHPLSKECTNKDTYTDPDKNYEEKSVCYEQKRCGGILHDCAESFPNLQHLWTCPATNGSYRRYDYVKAVTNSLPSKWLAMVGDQATSIYGDQSREKCLNSTLTHDNDFTESGFSLRQCELCSCVCEEDDDTTDKRVSGHPVVADVDHVIVGARLVKLNHVLYIQVLQGRILPNGKVDSNLTWKEVEESSDHKNDRMIHVLSYRQFRGVYLGPSKVDDQRVLVGVRIVNQLHGLHSYLAIRTLSLMYDYDNGSLVYDDSLYKNSSNNLNLWDAAVNTAEFPPSEVTEINLENSDIPLKPSDEPILPVEATKLYVKFRTSDFEKDIGQTTIPLIDIQEVISYPPVPLTSIGFYLKKSESNGGYIGLVLETYCSLRDLQRQYGNDSKIEENFSTNV